MTPPATTTVPPVGYRLHHRSGRPGSRWRVLAESLTLLPLLHLQRGGGEWWVEFVYTKTELKPETLQPSLFD